MMVVDVLSDGLPLNTDCIGCLVDLGDGILEFGDPIFDGRVRVMNNLILLESVFDVSEGVSVMR